MTRERKAKPAVEDRFAQILGDIARLYEAGRNGQVERKAKLFDELGGILRGVFSDKDLATLNDIPIDQLELISTLPSWHEVETNVA